MTTSEPVRVECWEWCVDLDLDHCRTGGVRILHTLQSPVDMDDWSLSYDFTEVGAGVEGATQGAAYVWDRQSDGREVLLTPEEARAKAAALVEAAAVAEAHYATGHGLLAVTHVTGLRGS